MDIFSKLPQGGERVAWIATISFFMILIRVVISLLKTISVKGGEIDSRDENGEWKDNAVKNKSWRTIFKGAFWFIDDNRIADYWQPALIGFAELCAYPLFMSMHRVKYIGFWLLLKTAAQWGSWQKSRTVYNRFLIGNILCIFFSYKIYYTFFLSKEDALVKLNLVFLKIFLWIVFAIASGAVLLLSGKLPNKGKIKRSIVLFCISIMASFSLWGISNIDNKELRSKLEEEGLKNRKAQMLCLSLGQDYDSFLARLAKSKNMGCAIPPSEGLDNEHFIKGYALYKVGGFTDEGENYKFAIEEFTLAEQESEKLKNSSELWLNIGFCYNQLGERAETIEALKKSIVLGECAQSYSTLAKIYVDNGEWEKAESLLNNAVKNKDLEKDEMIIYCCECIRQRKCFSQETYVRDKAEQKYKLLYLDE